MDYTQDERGVWDEVLNAYDIILLALDVRNVAQNTGEYSDQIQHYV
jgi:hypothetical protein